MNVFGVAFQTFVTIYSCFAADIDGDTVQQTSQSHDSYRTMRVLRIFVTVYSGCAVGINGHSV